MIRNLAGSHTILLSTHILPEVERTCDRVILIAGGRIRGQGTLKELQQKIASVSHYIVETDTAQGEKAVAALPCVAEVKVKRLDSTWYRLTVTARNEDDDLREEISRALAKVKSVTRELHRQTPSLENLFINMTDSSYAADDQGLSIGEEAK